MASTPHHACLDCPTLVRATTRRCRPCEDRRRKAERCQYGFIDHSRVPCPEIGCTRTMARQASRCWKCSLAAQAHTKASKPRGRTLRFPPETALTRRMLAWRFGLPDRDRPESPRGGELVHRPSAVVYGHGGARTQP